MASETEAGTGTSNYVYVASEEYSWIPARVVEYSKTDPNQVVVSIPSFKDEDSIQSAISSTSGAASRGMARTITIDLSKSASLYPNQTLPLQNVNENGTLQQVEDMVDLPFLHEVSTVVDLHLRLHLPPFYCTEGTALHRGTLLILV